MRKIIIFLTLLFISTLSQAQMDFSDVDGFIDANKEKLGKDFIVMVWKKDDTVVYRKQTNAQFRVNTQAPIASASKWLTAALVMMFVEEGKISLDDPVVQYIPEFGKYFKNYITIRHCLSQTTGIEGEPIKILKLLERKKFEKLEDEVNSFAARNIAANPGKEFYYGNIGLNIAGRVLEVVTKRRFDQLMSQKLFRLLAMRRSSFASLMGGAINPSGGAKSAADDYMNFLVMLLNKGKFRGQQILKEESVTEMMKLQTADAVIKYAPEAAAGFGYASGAWVLEDDGQGNGTALACPGLFGTWPLIDYKRGYAYLFFVKDFLGEEKAALHKEIISMLNAHFDSN